MPLDANRLRATLDSITDLPTLPSVVARITGQIANPSTNAADIGKMIEQDQVLAGKVLRLVNSAYYGFPKQIALATAIASKAAADHFGAAHLSEDAFIGGLLHDMGKIVMDQYQPTIYGPIVKYANGKGILLVDAEKEVMGLTHANVGEWILDKWRLPPTIVNLVADHHRPAHSQERRELISSIHLGDILARALGIGSGGDGRIPELDPIVETTFDTGPEAMEILVAKTMEELVRGQEFFALIASGA